MVFQLVQPHKKKLFRLLLESFCGTKQAKTAIPLPVVWLKQSGLEVR
jgi:hypothetical protein